VKFKTPTTPYRVKLRRMKRMAISPRFKPALSSRNMMTATKRISPIVNRP
jgi:hypothetical protein